MCKVTATAIAIIVGLSPQSQLLHSVFDGQSELPSTDSLPKCPPWLRASTRSWACSPGLPCGWQETNHFDHHLPESALTGNWSLEPKPGIRPRHPNVERQHSTPWLSVHSLRPSVLQSPYSGSRHPSPWRLGVWTGLQGPFAAASACAGAQSIKTSM